MKETTYFQHHLGYIFQNYALIDDDEWEGTSIYFGNRSNYSQNKVNEKYRKYRLLKKR